VQGAVPVQGGVPAKVGAGKGPPGGLRQISGAVVAVHIRGMDGDCRNRAHGAALNKSFVGEDRYCAMEPGGVCVCVCVCVWCICEKERGKGAVVSRHVRQRKREHEELRERTTRIRKKK